ncbi:MAG: DUF3150 domain-containing protein [Pseudomonadales bacterium]
MSNVAILDKTICINLVCTLWSGRRRLRAEDLGLDAEKLPPEELASLGSLKLCDPKQLTKLNSLKRAAERDCERVCVRFLGGYATDEKNISDLVAKLGDRKMEFERQAKQFIASLQTEIDGWVAKHPTWENVIRKALPDLGYVAGRLTFEFQLFRVRVAADETDSIENQGLVSATGGLSGQLFKEIEIEARTTWKRSYEGKDAVGQKALRPVRAIRDKLDALRFIDSRIVPMIGHIENVLGSLPQTGIVEGKDFMAVVGLLRLLADAEQMVRHGAKSLGIDASVQPDEGVDKAADSKVANTTEGTEATTRAEQAPHERPQSEGKANAAGSHWF